VALILVEQDADEALQLAHRAYVLETGEVVMQARARISSPRPRCGGRISGSDQITVLSYTGSGGLNGDRLPGDTILCSVPIASCAARGRLRLE
jgi:branched-chain amino acid transport system ATP-binding protein